ncbi:MAG: SGNH/GDSL hydrolase family protein [Clostridia bacterium]|nr:SGNH/GDSL hydrolase family protein [Clostridia bacterium]
MSKTAIFILFGQSNATGHGVPMSEEDIIKEPLQNVWGLNREPNQSFDTEKLKFSRYTSYGMNLAENQDNTYSVANCLAKNWQKEIDNGVNLPDLYVIQISIGGQGVYGMWSPTREKKLIPGKLEDVNISMYPLSTHILTLLKEHLDRCEIEPDYIGIHWRGGEQEFWQHINNLRNDDRLKNVYKTMLGGWRDALKCDCPVVFHKLNFEGLLKGLEDGKHIPSMNYINEVYSDLCKELPDISMFDSLNAPHYDPNNGYSLFRWDMIHYNPETNDWVSQEIIKNYKEKNNL